MLLSGITRYHLTWFPRRGMCLTACDRKRPEVGPGFFPTMKREMSWMKKKKLTESTAGAVHCAAVESSLLSQHHAIIAHCAVLRYEDGDQRAPGWITVTTQGPGWRVTVKDPDSCASFVVTAPTIDEALLMTNLLLESDDAPWTHDKWLQKGKKKRD